jgi:hypothetical protein
LKILSMRAMPSKQSMSYLASFSTSKLQKKPSPTCLLVSQSLAAPVLVCHLRLGAPLLTSALISRAPRGRRVSENPHVFVKLDSCPGSVCVSLRWNCDRVPKSKHSSSNSSVVYLRSSHQNTASCSFITSLSTRIGVLSTKCLEQSCLVYWNGRHLGRAVNDAAREAP